MIELATTLSDTANPHGSRSVQGGESASLQLPHLSKAPAAATIARAHAAP